MKAELYYGGGDQYQSREEMLAGMAKDWIFGYKLGGQKMSPHMDAEWVANDCIKDWDLSGNYLDTGKSHMSFNGYNLQDLVREFRTQLGEKEPSRERKQEPVIWVRFLESGFAAILVFFAAHYLFGFTETGAVVFSLISGVFYLYGGGWALAFVFIMSLVISDDWERKQAERARYQADLCQRAADGNVLVKELADVRDLCM